jgi:chromosome segregation ATPase
MAEQIWLTYRELADRLGISPDGARMKAKRRGWTATTDNEGHIRVCVPAAFLERKEPNVRNVVLSRTFAERSAEQSSAIKVLEAGLETLKQQLARAHTDLDRERDERASERDRLRADHAAEVKRLEDQAMRERAATAEAERRYQNLLMDRVAEVERLEQQLRAADDRAGKADARVDDVLAEVRALRGALEDVRRPWWRKLVGR